MSSKEALEYEGLERPIIRSAALLTVGIANLIVSLLPSSLISAAKFVSGFAGEREAALDALLTCWREDGLLAAFAGLCWCAYQIDTKTFLGENQSEDDFQQCAEIFEWAHARFPNSIFFSILESDLVACQGDVERAQQISNSAEQYTVKHS